MSFRSERLPSYFQERTLSRPLTQELQALSRLVPDLTAETGEICEASVNNITGALFLKLRSEELQEIYKTSGAALPVEVRYPVEIIPDVPLMAPKHPHAVEFQDFGDTCDAVLVKHSPGDKVGLVIEGPYAGLLVRSYRGKRMCDQVRAIRLLNDEVFHPHILPYMPDVFPDPDLSDQENIALRKKVEKWFHYSYLKLVYDMAGIDTTQMSVAELLDWMPEFNNGKIVRPNFYLTEIMQALAAQLNLPLDARKMCFTRATS